MFNKNWILLAVVALFFVACIAPPSMKKNSNADYPKVTYPEGVSSPSRTLAVTSGNSNLGRVEIGNGSKNSLEVESHSYKVIVSKDELLELPPIKTYVLLPRNLSKVDDNTTALYKRYTRLLSLIQQIHKVEETGDQEIDNQELAHENVFLLFAKTKSEKVTVKNYNYAISNKILKFFRKNYSASIFREEGPFLITTTKNVKDGVEDFTFLYVNLSKFNKSAIDEIVGAYKERLITKGDDEISTLEKWHSRLLSFVTNFGNDIHIFQTAVADTFRP